MPGVSEVLGDLVPRLRAAARAVTDADDHVRSCRELRDRLIVQAVDEGMPHAVVAEAVGVSRARVLAVLARSQPGQLLT